MSSSQDISSSSTSLSSEKASEALQYKQAGPFKHWRTRGGFDRGVKYPKLFEVMSRDIAKNKEATSSTRYQVEPIQGRNDKVLLRVEGQEDPIELDVPERDLQAGLPINEGVKTPSDYDKKKAKAEKAGKLEEFQKYYRDRAKARYDFHKDQGRPTYSYQRVAAKIRKNILLVNNPALVEERENRKKTRDRQNVRNKSRKARAEKVLSEEERLRMVEKKKKQQREASHRYYTKMRAIRAEKELAGADGAEPSHAGAMVNILESTEAYQTGHRSQWETLSSKDGPPLEVKTVHSGADVTALKKDQKEKKKEIDLNAMPSDDSDGDCRPLGSHGSQG